MIVMALCNLDVAMRSADMRDGFGIGLGSMKDFDWWK